jgi:hypothetical protein
MTVAEWLASADPEAMLACLGERVSDRKLRLFACACCRRVWHLIASPPAWAAVEASEQYADGLISVAELREVAVGRWEAPVCIAGASEQQALHALLAAARASREYRSGPVEALHHVRCADPDALSQANLLRDIIGNPHRKVAIDPTWLNCNGGQVAVMAQQMYDERSFDLLPILADALEDAGCTDARILEHLRGTGLHVRGCWAVDLLTGRE